jgi:hypothetical protein
MLNHGLQPRYSTTDFNHDTQSRTSTTYPWKWRSSHGHFTLTDATQICRISWQILMEYFVSSLVVPNRFSQRQWPSLLFISFSWSLYAGKLFVCLHHMLRFLLCNFLLLRNLFQSWVSFRCHVELYNFLYMFAAWTQDYGGFHFGDNREKFPWRTGILIDVIYWADLGSAQVIPKPHSFTSFRARLGPTVAMAPYSNVFF